MAPFPPHLAWLREPAAAAAGDPREPAGDPNGRAATWRYAWPAGARLAAELTAVLDCGGRRFADLGCGRGHLGLTALAADAGSVLFADGHAEAVAAIAAVLALNALTGRGRAVRHDWGAPLPDPPYDRILGGDILYRPECFAALLDTVATSLTGDGECLLSDPRHRLEDELPGLAAARGLVWTSERRAGYTLVRLRRHT